MGTWAFTVPKPLRRYNRHLRSAKTRCYLNGRGRTGMGYRTAFSALRFQEACSTRLSMLLLWLTRKTWVYRAGDLISEASTQICTGAGNSLCASFVDLEVRKRLMKGLGSSWHMVLPV